MPPDYRMMDPALEMLDPYGPDLRNGLTNHDLSALQWR